MFLWRSSSKKQETAKKNESSKARIWIRKGRMASRIDHMPCLDDNYAYLIINGSTGEVAMVDPAELKRVLKAAREHGIDGEAGAHHSLSPGPC
ncbi:HMA domain-containing protein [Psidium guajava]|nr:HMA domain-containing protein [Psidium guajava]